MAMTLIEIIKREFEQAKLVDQFLFELVECYNEDYKHNVPGVLIKHVKRSDFCIFMAHLNDSQMRRPIDPDKTYDSTVTGVWKPYLEPQWQRDWINEYEFSTDDIHHDDKSALEDVVMFVSEQMAQIK